MANLSNTDRLMAFVLLSLLLPFGASVPITVSTIHSPDGDIIDCIDRTTQPAFSHPLLKNHIFQEKPTDMASMVEKEYIWQVWHKNGTKCPDGTIPVRRMVSDQIASKSNAEERATKGHEYAIGGAGKKSQPKFFGTQATMNVWQPTIEASDEFSLGQIWLTSGSYATNDLNSIEAGWQVYPMIYFDHQPRLFIYWTADAYNLTGCYNLRCGGFVQISRTIAIEAAIVQTSIFGSTQLDLTIKIWKDQKLGVWWLGVVHEHGVLEPVGYWPALLFTHLSDYAQRVQWSGEIINKYPFGRHTRTEMGSGYFPDSGFGNAAYMSNLEIAQLENDFQPLQDLMVGGSHLDYYRAKKSNNTHFYYGGPRQLAIAFHPTLDSSLIYLCFTLFFLF